MNISSTKLKKAKKAIEEGKTLKEIIDTESLKVKPAQLNQALIERYGTENIGNPMKKIWLRKQAESVFEKASVDMTKDEVIALLEDLLAKAKA
jgi:FKBP-type peptidyl-prolyl cis-trans isomerase (trigger factor)